MLAENYIDLPNNSETQQNGETNKNNIKNLELSMNITLNKLIDKKSKEFLDNNKLLINEIRNENNINSKYTLLTELYKNYLIDDAKF
jgi:hypothetical protein